MYSMTFVGAFLRGCSEISRLICLKKWSEKGGLRKESESEVWKHLAVVESGKARTKNVSSLERKKRENTRGDDPVP